MIALKMLILVSSTMVWIVKALNGIAGSPCRVVQAFF
jgi:hypothetical protein